jgi:hypothetical protein
MSIDPLDYIAAAVDHVAADLTSEDITVLIRKLRRIRGDSGRHRTVLRHTRRQVSDDHVWMRSERTDETLTYLRAADVDVAPGEVAHSLNCRLDTARCILNRLVKRGHAVRVGRGLYRAAPGSHPAAPASGETGALPLVQNVA